MTAADVPAPVPDGDVLGALRDRLDALDGAPVAEHPGVLEAVHRALVAELESLAGAGSGVRRPGR